MMEASVADLFERAEELQREGRDREVGALCRDIFRAATAAGDPAALAEAARLHARALRRAGAYDEAEEMALLGYEIAERNHLPAAAARAVNVLANISHFLHRWDEAAGLYEEAIERALDVGDDELVGYACQNLGVLANVRGDLPEARLRYLEGVAAAIRSRNERGQAMIYNNLGMVSADLGEWLSAELFFGRGEEIAERIGDEPLLRKLRVNRAEPLIELGEIGRAATCLDLAEASDAGATPQAACDVLRYRGLISLRRGERAEGVRLLQESASCAEEERLPLEAGEALRELGRLHLAAGRPRDGRSLLREARTRFLASGADRDVASIDRLLAEPVPAPEPVPS